MKREETRWEEMTENERWHSKDATRYVRGWNEKKWYDMIWDEMRENEMAFKSTKQYSKYVAGCVKWCERERWDEKRWKRMKADKWWYDIKEKLDRCYKL